MRGYPHHLMGCSPHIDIILTELLSFHETHLAKRGSAEERKDGLRSGSVHTETMKALLQRAMER